MGDYSCGTFEDTVWPRCRRLFARFKNIELLLETLDVTACDAEEQQELHARLDALEAWMDDIEQWDRDGGGVQPWHEQGGDVHG